MTLDLLLLGLAIALEPFPITAHILLLGSENGVRKGLGFVLGWVLTLVLVVVLTLVFTGGKPLVHHSAPSRAMLIVLILLGLSLLVFAWRKRAQRGRPPKQQSWMANLDKLGFAAAMGLGFFLQPWTLVAAGVARITDADLSKGSAVLTLVLFCLLASASYLTMQTYAMARPEAARTRLDGLKTWIAVHQDQVVIVVSTAIGLWLVAKGAYLLAT